MKIGILQCDDVMERLQPAHGNYPEMITALLHEQDPELVVRSYASHRGDLPARLDECDGYLTTGSRFGVNDGLPWIDALRGFVADLHAAHHPLVGICFGHQMMAVALGGEVRKSDKGWGVGMSFNEIVARKPWMEPYQPSLDLVVSHQDQVTRLPPDAEILARSAFCPYYMVQYGNHFLGVQGHPEFCKSYSCDLMQARRGIIPEARIREGLASLSAEVDDRLMMRWILRFLRTR
ncbi:MAG: type 1 glutamine amidotransferase [Rhodocyclaceae bacterium]